MENRAGTTGEVGAASEPTRSTRMRTLGGAALTLLLDLLLADAAAETYASGSLVRWWVVAPVALYLATTAWLVLQGVPFGRGPGWFTLPATPLAVALAVLAVSANSRDGMTHGMRLVQQPTSTLLAGATVLVVLLAAFCFMRPPGARWWWRVIVAAIAAYSVVALGLAVVSGTPYFDLLQQGRGFWQRLPYWLHGAFLGGLVMVPMALVWEIGLALARLVIKGRMALILLLALGLWIAWLGLTVGPN
jgi:hypothetical protein